MLSFVEFNTPVCMSACSVRRPKKVSSPGSSAGRAHGS